MGAAGAAARTLSTIVTWPWRALLGRPYALPAPLLARYPELGAVRWRRGGLPLRVGGWCLRRSTVSGITLGRTVFLHDAAALAPALLLHELAHVGQFARVRAFPLWYAWESLRRGYHHNRFELEADAFAARILAERPPVRGTHPAVAPPAARVADAARSTSARPT